MDHHLGIFFTVSPRGALFPVEMAVVWNDTQACQRPHKWGHALDYRESSPERNTSVPQQQLSSCTQSQRHALETKLPHKPESDMSKLVVTDNA